MRPVYSLPDSLVYTGWDWRRFDPGYENGYRIQVYSDTRYSAPLAFN